MPYVCDGNSVGVLIIDSLDRILMITRAKDPSGIAPVAGHVKDSDADLTHLEAAVIEADEEVGLTIDPADLEEVYEGHLPNLCGAVVPAVPAGHRWVVARTRKWSGRVRRAPGEVRAFGWYTPDQVQALADRTVAYAYGQLPAAKWDAAPGLEPVWVDILSTVPPIDDDPARAMVRVSDPEHLRTVRRLYAASPV